MMVKEITQTLLENYLSATLSTWLWQNDTGLETQGTQTYVASIEKALNKGPLKNNNKKRNGSDMKSV